VHKGLPRRLALCSNRAATWTNILKPQEKHQIDNMLICGGFANSRNLQQTFAPPLYGGGQGFESPRLHSIKWLKKTLVGDAQHQDGDVVTGGLLLEVQHGLLYTAGNGRSVESN
jgi:hypothetical protein